MPHLQAMHCTVKTKYIDTHMQKNAPSEISGSSNNTSRTSREMAPRLLGLWDRVGRAGRPVSGSGVAHEQLARTAGRFSAGNGDCNKCINTQRH